MTYNIKNRDSIIVWKPVNLNSVEKDFPLLVAEVESEYPKFKVNHTSFESRRVRWMNESDHYEFYLERVKS